MLKRPQETESLLEREWDEVRNLPLRFCDVSPGSHKRVWWRCERGHEWQAVVYVRAQDGTGCPYCAGRKVLAGFNDLASQQPKLAEQWHEELNGELKPCDITAGSSRRVWWKCEYGHVWRAAVYSRTGAKKCGCPVCAGNIKRTRTWENKDSGGYGA